MNTLLNRSFVSVIFAQIASLFGDAVLRFALPLYVLNQTGSAALMGAVSACAWIPYIVLTPIGGVAADRVNKRRIMAALDILLAATCAAFLALDGVIDLVGLCICALIVLYAAQSVYQPTVQAAVPFIVPRDGIVRATAIVSQISALSGLVGPVLGGLLFGLFGIEPVVFVSGAAFAVSAVLIVTVVRIPRDAIERSGVGVVRTVANDIVESFAFLRHERTVILKVIFLVAGINVTLTAFILIGAPVVITQILGLPNQYMGFAEGALALGGLAGGVSVGVFAGRLRLSRAPLFLLVAALGLLPIAVVLGVWAVAFGALRLRDALRRRASGQPWGCCAGDAAVKFAVGIFMLASPLGSMAAWTVMVGLFFLFVGASVIFSAVYLDRLPHDFEDF